MEMTGGIEAVRDMNQCEKDAWRPKNEGFKGKPPQ
jgi:hypothetical protein